MIESPTNPKIKNIIKLRKAGERRRQGIFLVEGYKEIMMAVQNGYIVKELYYCADYHKAKLNQDTIPAQSSFSLGAKVFDRIALRQNPDGFLALAELREHNLSDIKLSENPLLIVIEAVEKPGNLGAILRTADAVLADGVIICDPKTDLYNPNVVRASLGTIFSVPLAVSTKEDALKYLQDNSIDIFASTPSAKEYYFDLDLKKPMAVLVGTEHEGLSNFWLTNAGNKIRIPMKGKIDSLNASVSTAIIVYEALRQRL
jgi:TrmH family RNA methyltransferase